MRKPSWSILFIKFEKNLNYAADFKRFIEFQFKGAYFLYQELYEFLKAKIRKLSIIGWKKIEKKKFNYVCHSTSANNLFFPTTDGQSDRMLKPFLKTETWEFFSDITLLKYEGGWLCCSSGDCREFDWVDSCQQQPTIPRSTSSARGAWSADRWHKWSALLHRCW